MALASEVRLSRLNSVSNNFDLNFLLRCSALHFSQTISKPPHKYKYLIQVHKSNHSSTNQNKFHFEKSFICQFSAQLGRTNRTAHRSGRHPEDNLLSRESAGLPHSETVDTQQEQNRGQGATRFSIRLQPDTNQVRWIFIKI